jgi:hypothetical protein
LLRVVVAPDAIGTTSRAVPIVPDPRRRAPGRGAWLHRDLGCVDAAQRRQAVGRALRVPGPVDLTAVRHYLAAAGQHDSTNDSRTNDSRTNDSRTNDSRTNDSRTNDSST